MPIEKSHHSRRGNCQEPGTMRQQVTWFVVSWWLWSWELSNFSAGMSSCLYLMTHGNEGHWALGNCSIPNTPFLDWFRQWPWDDMLLLTKMKLATISLSDAWKKFQKCSHLGFVLFSRGPPDILPQIPCLSCKCQTELKILYVGKLTTGIYSNSYVTLDRLYIYSKGAIENAWNWPV